jgi:hypothetical protein
MGGYIDAWMDGKDWARARAYRIFGVSKGRQVLDVGVQGFMGRLRLEGYRDIGHTALRQKKRAVCWIGMLGYNWATELGCVLADRAASLVDKSQCSVSRCLFVYQVRLVRVCFAPDDVILGHFSSSSSFYPAVA